MPLPPFGTIDEQKQTHLDVAKDLSDRARESCASRDKWAAYADKNQIVYQHGEYPAPDETKRIINPIMNAVLADVTIQTREKIAVTLTPAETGDPGEVYYADESMYGGLPPTPIDPKQAAMMQQPQPMMDEMGEPAMDPMTGGPALAEGMPKESFIVLDDKLCSEIWQGVFDRMWKRSGFDRWIKRSLTSNGVHGWYVGNYEWDEIDKKHRVRDLSVWQAYLDPTDECLDNHSYAGIDFVLDEDEAVKMYPDFAEMIRAGAKPGTPNRPDEVSNLGRADMLYERNVVTLRCFWIRNQLFPMSEEEAVASGAVVQQEVVDEQQVGGNAGDSDVLAGAEGAGVGSSLPVGDGELAAVESPDQAPAPNGSILETMVPSTRLAYVLAGSGTEVTPDSPDWPTRYGTRQVTVIESAVVDDRECEHWDIPILHNVNRPIPGKPWGIGEPWFLMNLQKAYNSLIDGNVAYALAHKNPVPAIPQSIANALRKEYGDAKVDPGRTLEIPDSMWQQFGGKVVDWHVPPTLADAPLKMSEILRHQINEQSGQTDAVRGILPSAQTSGKAVELLQDSATSMIQHKSQSTEGMVERLANLMHYSHIWRLEIADIRKIVSKYPDYVLEAAQRKARESEWDIEVMVSGGSAAIVAQKKLESVQRFQVRDPSTGEPLQGIETTREDLNIDHAFERDSWERQSAILAQRQSQMMQEEAETKAKSSGGEKAHSSNGNGRF